MIVTLKVEPSPSLLLADELEASLWQDVLDPWFPACVDPAGGFRQNFDREWKATEEKERFLVFQSRMTWVSATIAETDHHHSERFAGYARHGVRFLADSMFDSATGAFFGSVDMTGKPAGFFADNRDLYGMAFAIYGLAAAARALKDEEALELAKRVFGYVETFHRDPVHRGYFEYTDASGAPIFEFEAHPRFGRHAHEKSQNSHLHLLEAFGELYRVWPDTLVRQRLEDMVSMFVTEFYSESGWLHMYLARDGSPVAGSMTFGHDVEVAHLLLAALDALGDSDAEVVWKAQSYVDHSLEFGWDEKDGGFYATKNLKGVVDTTKIWWVQAEGLLALGVLWKHTGSAKYWKALLAQWDWIRNHQIDSEYRGWFSLVNESGQETGSLNKGNLWKAAYHDGRGMLFTPRVLRG